MSPKRMQQQELPFEEPLQPGWQGKRYLLCNDGQWHLVLRILDGDMADTQCCADVEVILPPASGSREPMCQECVRLHFAPKKGQPSAAP
jgi:hypothetical protein